MDMVPIKWDRPGSRYHGVVHFVAASMVKEGDGPGRVVVMWPRKGKEPEKWIGTRVDDPDATSTSEQPGEPK